MTFNPNIPQPGDLISNSQGQILTNFGQLDTIFSVDHFTWDDATVANRGMHKQVDLPVVRGSDPVLSSANTGMFYSKSVSGAASPFFAGWNGSSTVVIPLGGAATTPVFVPGQPGRFYFPGGFMIEWNVETMTPNPKHVTFPFPFAACYSVQISPTAAATISNPIVLGSGSVSPTGFTATTSSGTINGFFWIAVGQAP